MPHSNLAIVKHSVYVLLSIWLAIVIYWHLRSLSGFLTLRGYEFQPWLQIRYWTLYLWLPWIPLVPIMLYLANKVPIRPNNWARSVLAQLAAMFILSLSHGFLAALLYYQVGWMDADMATYARWQHTGHFLFEDNVFLFDAFVYAVVAASQNIHNFYTQLQQKELDAVRIKSELTASKLQVLKMQINPHFLFNTLNSIAVLIRQNQTASANAMVQRLSDFFRQTLREGDDEMVTLRQEIELVRGYLEIEKVRFGARLQVEYSVAPDSLSVLVPTLLLQPLVENAMKHGLSMKKGNCSLELIADLTGGDLRVTIVDNGAGMAGYGTNPGIGLKNVSSRLQHYYGKKFSFSFDSGEAGGARVDLVIPAQRLTAEVAWT